LSREGKEMKKVLSVFLAMSILVTFQINCVYSQNSCLQCELEYSGKLTGQQRAALLTNIKVAEQNSNISSAEGNSLRNLINLDYGYPELLNDYIYQYKRRGRSMDEFMSDVYSGKIPDPPKK
jgi:hypothetical protein